MTTQDISILDVIPKNNVKVIPIEGGFTPEESLKVSLQKSTKGPSLYYVRVFWGFFEPTTYLRKDILTT